MAVQSASRHLRASMTIPGTATQVAPEAIYPNADKDAASVYFGSATSKQTVQKVQVLIENLIATATAVVQYLRPGGSWATPADVFVAQTLSAAGLWRRAHLAQLAGARDRHLRRHRRGDGRLRRLGAVGHALADHPAEALPLRPARGDGRRARGAASPRSAPTLRRSVSPRPSPTSWATRCPTGSTR